MKERWKMSDLGLFNTKFEINQRLLSDYDTALRKLHLEKDVQLSEKEKACDSILKIIKPLCDSLNSTPSATRDLNESHIKESLKNRFVKKHNLPWSNYIEIISVIREKLEQHKCNFKNIEISVLNDIGDALNIECSKLFHRIRGR